MKLIVPDPDDRIVRAARAYRAPIETDLSFEGMPRPWVALDVTTLPDARPLSWVDMNKVLGGTLMLGYGPPFLPDDELERADVVAYVEQIGDAARLTRDQALAVFLHRLFLAMRGH